MRFTGPVPRGMSLLGPVAAFALAAAVGASTPAEAAPSQPIPLPVLDCSTTVVAESHDTAVSHFKTGESAILAERWPEAEAALLKSVAADPLLAIAHYGLGQTYMSQQRFAEAVSAFSTARDAFRCQRPLSPEERSRKEAQIRDLRDTLRQFDQRRLKEIVAKWKEANGDARTPGDQMRTAQDVERQLTELERSLKDPDPSPPGVTLALGTALFQTGDMGGAETAFRAVLARDPRSGDAHNNLSLVCMLSGRLEEAEKEMEAALRAGVPVNPRLKQEIERRKREAVKKL